MPGKHETARAGDLPPDLIVIVRKDRLNCDYEEGFIVVRQRESYFNDVLHLVKESQQSRGTWTEEDENRWEASGNHLKRELGISD